MVNLAFEEMWSPTLCCFISSTHLIDRVPTEPPPSCKRAECTALSVWQLGFLHLRLTKSKKSEKKRQRHRSWQAFSKLSFIANVSFETLTSRKRQTLGPVVLQWPNMGLMVTRKSGRSCKCCWELHLFCLCARVFVMVYYYWKPSFGLSFKVFKLTSSFTHPHVLS